MAYTENMADVSLSKVAPVVITDRYIEWGRVMRCYKTSGDDKLENKIVKFMAHTLNTDEDSGTGYVPPANSRGLR